LRKRETGKISISNVVHIFLQKKTALNSSINQIKHFSKKGKSRKFPWWQFSGIKSKGLFFPLSVGVAIIFA